MQAVYSLKVDRAHPKFWTRGPSAKTELLMHQIPATFVLTELQYSPVEAAEHAEELSAYTTVFPLPSESPSGQAAKLAEAAALLSHAGHSEDDKETRVQRFGVARTSSSSAYRVQIRLPQQAWIAAKMNLGIKAVDRCVLHKCIILCQV